MTNLILGYKRPKPEEFKTLWKKGTFVFDANVLLSLYSYPEKVREVFLSVLKKIENRIWIPYQVALEFERNRIPRITQSNRKIEKLLSSIQTTSDSISREIEEVELEKRDIGISDLPQRLEAVRKAHDSLAEAVRVAVEKLPSVSLEDPIRDQLLALIGNRIGDPPPDQNALDALVSDGQDRFTSRIPPGFEDAEKGTDSYSDRGLIYQRKFGDLILWRQLINHTKETHLKEVILVTSDRKSDWWWNVDGKALGPLPELTQEICLLGGVNSFWMYTADQFLKYAEDYLQAKEVTEEAVDKVKEIASKPIQAEDRLNKNLVEFFVDESRYRLRDSETGQFFSNPFKKAERKSKFHTHWIIENAVKKWLEERHPDGNITSLGAFPDIVVEIDDELYGYEIKYLWDSSDSLAWNGVASSLALGHAALSQGSFRRFALVIALSEHDPLVLNEDPSEEFPLRLASLLKTYPVSEVIIGLVRHGQFSSVRIMRPPRVVSPPPPTRKS